MNQRVAFDRWCMDLWMIVRRLDKAMGGWLGRSTGIKSHPGL